jgi:malonyl-CoA O-methyltransferase
MKAHPARDYVLEQRVVRRAFDRASTSYDDSAVLQEQVRSRLLERLDLVSLQPATVLDAGCGTGLAIRPLLRRYRRSRVVALDLSEGMLDHARRRKRWGRAPSLVCADAGCLPLGDDSVDLVFSNLMLQWCNDLDGVLAEFRRVLRPGGLLGFTTFGPDTLTELRQAWSEVDGHVHVSRFLDMHDVGDALVRASLAEPVLDVDYFRLTYDRVTDIMKDLRAIGATNAAVGRRRNLTGPGRLRAVTAAYERYRVDGRLPTTWEVVYGFAWSERPTPGSGTPGETVVPVASIGHRAGMGD